MDACPCAPCIKHHRIEDAAVVCWSAETGKDAPDAVGQIQERGPDLGSAQPRDSEQEQEQEWKWHGELHLHSGESAKKQKQQVFLLQRCNGIILLNCFELLKKSSSNCC